MNRKRITLYILCSLLGTGGGIAQNEGWFLQTGLDMSLQNPYGYNFSKVFPNGKTFGVDVAVGRWFTQAFGLRAKVNWENGIGLFRNDHANWLAPFHEPGRNMDKGGYLGFVGDVLFNAHSLFCGYDQQRRWNLSVFPRAGLEFNFGVEKGSPLVGLGVSNTYRLNDRLSVYADLSYNMVSSGHVGVVESTGLGSNSNGYLNFDAGVQVDLNSSHVIRQADQPLWSGWYLQAGLAMQLVNPYGHNFSKVFPNGKTFGIEGAVGKNLSPLVGIRGKLEWQNGLIDSDHVTWLEPVEQPGENHEKGGNIFVYGDILMNLNNILGGCDGSRRWNVSVYPRAGLYRNIAADSNSPLLGVGVENTYRMDGHWSIYCDVDYQVTTSDASVGKTGMDVSLGTNGFFGLHVGVQFDIK